MTSSLTGLRREDLYDEGLSEVKEAVRRLPENEKNLRLYRLKRAVDLDLKKNILPKEQWTKPEEVPPSCVYILVAAVNKVYIQMNHISSQSKFYTLLYCS